MKLNTAAIISAVAMAGQTQARIGRAAGLLGGLFGNDAASLLGELAPGVPGGVLGKRDGFEPVAKRQVEGVPQYVYDQCASELIGNTVTYSAPSASEIQFVGVPPTCMNLANVLVGNPVDGPYALPCGSDCLSYTGLTDAQFNELAGVLNTYSD